MAPALPPPEERARKMHSMALRYLQAPGRQTSIATSMGVAESTISRLKNEHLESLCKLLALAGLKIVPVEFQCFPADKVNALLTLSKAHLESIESAHDMTDEEHQ